MTEDGSAGIRTNSSSLWVYYVYYMPLVRSCMKNVCDICQFESAQRTKVVVRKAGVHYSASTCKR